MQQSLAKRGPDAGGHYVDKHVGLVHRRLVVVDPENGAQPMQRRVNDVTYVIVYNGELYNTDELRAELGELGYEFSGSGDTEVLLCAFIQWREKCVDMLNGIFAFAVWIVEEGRLFCARDKFGVKPFFYKRTRHGIVFSSEIKGLFKNPLCPAVIDKAGINRLFLLSPARLSGDGVYKGVRELRGGEYLWASRLGVRVKRYYRVRARAHTEDLEQSKTHLRELVTDAIKRQLVSDVPLGCFLSGGLDSSIITQIASEKYKAEGAVLSTFSVDYVDNDKNFVQNAMQPDTDDKYIDIMSDFAGTNHKKVVLENETVVEALYNAAVARDLPGMADVDSSLIPFCTEIKKTHTVCLSGECADELFAGYPWYFDANAMEDGLFPWARSVDMRVGLLNKRYLCKNPRKFVEAQVANTIKRAEVLPTDTAHDRKMRGLFMLNLDWFMQTLLERKDRMSMYCGLEVRVPFCDARLVEYAYNLPFEIKTLGGREKGLLREAFRGILPDSIVERKKNPYPKTFDPRFLTEVKRRATEVMDKGGVVSQIIDREYFDKLIASEASQAGVTWYGQLMRLPQVLAWIVQMDVAFTELGVKIG